MTAPDVVGIDFSGSQSPGRKIWITESVQEGEVLQVKSSEPARNQFEVRGRESIFKQLREYCRSNRAAVIGLDFPFGLPSGTVEATGWTSFLKAFATEFEDESINAYPGSYETESQQRREVDYRHAGQSPMSPQVRYQVFYGLRDFLYPLVREDAARVCPMQSRENEKPTLIEVYPAATLGRLGLYRTGYKDSPGARRRRDATVEEISSRDDVDLSKIDTGQLKGNDDTLDSLIAALATRRAIRKGLKRELDSEVEGYIYT